jgi:nucleoside-diphosphate-sugar epimerase
MKRVFVTGVSGRVGSVTAREFLAAGYTVRAMDNRPLPEDLRGSVEPVYLDLTDRLGLLRALEGCEAIAHLAAIPSPHQGEENIFPTNVTGTYNIFSAAEAHGIKRIALASTCCAFGIFFARHQWDPHYLPMNEKHPNLPQDMYGLSKVLNEETAAAFTRRCGMTTIALRLTTVMDLSKPHSWMKHSLGRDDRRNDLWSYIDTRDTARAFRLAIENSVEGTHTTAIIAARDTMNNHSIQHLVEKNFPALANQIANLAPEASLYDTSLAETAFGFVAQNGWRDLPEFQAVS